MSYIRAKAPLRISFGGGGSDVPPYPELEGGCVLSATINRYAWGTLRPRADARITIESRDMNASLSFGSLSEIAIDGQMDLAKAALRRLSTDGSGCDVFLHADSPPGTGLGSSSAMIVSLVGLMTEWQSIPLTDYEIAETAYGIERTDLGITGGMQDQYAATFGGFNFIEFHADRVLVNSLKVRADTLNELEYNLLLVNTGTSRMSAGIIADQVERFERREKASLDALREVKRIAIDMKDRVLRRQLDDFGALLHEEWEHKKLMSDRISNARIDELYDLARRKGALGGKIAGAGGGGHLLLYCAFGMKYAVADALTEAGCTPSAVAFEPMGLQTWRAH